METTTTRALTRREQDMLDAIVRYLGEHHGRPPSVRDLTTLTGVRSTGHVHLYLTRLEAKGCIRRDHAQARSIRLTGVGVPHPVCPYCGQERVTSTTAP